MANFFNNDARCKALWRFESGALTTDSKGANTLTAYNTPTADTDAGNFQEGSAATKLVAASSQYYKIADADQQSGFPLKNGETNKQLTLCGLFRITSVTGNKGLFGKVTQSGSVGCGLYVYNGVLYISYNSLWQSTGIAIAANIWYHAGMAYNGDTGAVTVRVFKADNSTTYNYSATKSVLNIGARDFVIGEFDGSNFADGNFDEIVVFNALLTVAEIDQIRSGVFGTAGTYVGQIPLMFTPQAETYGSHSYVGQIPLTLTPQANSGGHHAYVGHQLVRFTPITAYEPVVVPGSITAIPASTGGWAMGGAGVWGGSTPISTVISADAEPTGFYLGGGAADGEPEVISIIPGSDVIAAEVAFKFCGPGVTGNVTTSEPSQDVIEVEGGFVLGGAGTWGQVKPVDIPSTALVPTGGWILSGSGFSLDSAVTPTETVIVSTGGWVLGGPRPDPVEVTYPGSVDRAIISSGGWEFGGNEGVWGQVKPAAISNTVLESSGGWVLSGSGFSLDPIITPTTTVIIPTGGFVLGGLRPDSVEVTYPDSVDRVIISSGGWELGGNAGGLERSIPAATVIESAGAIFILGGAGLATSRMPPIAVITGDATGGFVLSGTGWPLAAEVYEAWVLNAQSFEPSVFSGFNFNSFATKGGQAYACGDAGIYLLGGDTDAGEPIQSGARVGPVNFNSAGTKRIRGVVFGQGGPSTRVRVRTDEAEGVFAPDRDTDRVTVSRDLQASEFTVDILNFDELSHLEIFPLRLARR